MPEPLPLSKVALEVLFLWGGTLAAYASIRAFVYFIIQKRWGGRTEVLIAILAISVLALSAEILNLTVREEVYLAAEVEKILDIQSKPRSKPTSAQLNVRSIPYTDQPWWITAHAYWLRKEGERDKEVGQSASYAIAEIEYIVPFPTKSFNLVLRAAPPDNQIFSQTAFRETKIGSSKVYEPLQPIPKGENFRWISLSVPPAEEGDRLIVIARISSSSNTLPNDLTEIITNEIE